MLGNGLRDGANVAYGVGSGVLQHGNALRVEEELDGLVVWVPGLDGAEGVIHIGEVD